jgi:hypothetical protein
MKKGWIITILFILLLVAAGFIGYKIKKCPVIKIPDKYVKDEHYLDSLQKVGVLKDECIDSLKKRITIYRKQNETEKTPITIRIDSIGHDSIPDVFMRLADYYSKQ